MHPLSLETIKNLQELGDRPQHILLRYLTDDGLATGTKNMAAAADDYYIKPATNEIFIITKIIISMFGAGSLAGNFEFDNYANFDAPLTNGCLLELRRDPSGSNPLVMFDLLDGLPIKTNADLFRLGNLTAEISDSQAGIKCEIDTKNLFGGAIRVTANRGDTFHYQVQDSLATLALHYVQIGGFIFKDLIS